MHPTVSWKLKFNLPQVDFQPKWVSQWCQCLCFKYKYKSNGLVVSIEPILFLCDGNCVQYVLRGVIYFDNHHFTERIITGTGMVWYHDGIFAGRSLVYESQGLTAITSQNAVMAFYIRSPANVETWYLFTCTWASISASFNHRGVAYKFQYIYNI